MNLLEDYLIGWTNYYIFYSPIWIGLNLKFLIPKYIRKQIEFRIIVMKRECYNSGSCVKCGCATTALQMCARSCDGLCYPPFLSRKHWEDFINSKDVASTFRSESSVWSLNYMSAYKSLTISHNFYISNIVNNIIKIGNEYKLEQK